MMEAIGTALALVFIVGCYAIWAWVTWKVIKTGGKL